MGRHRQDLPGNDAAKTGRVAARALRSWRQSHRPYSLWKDPASTAIFEAVEAAVADFPGLVTGQRKGFSAWSRNFQFAAVRPLKGGKARLGLCAPPDADPRLVEPKNEGWSERLKAAITLDSPAEVDARLKALLRTAFDKS